MCSSSPAGLRSQAAGRNIVIAIFDCILYGAVTALLLHYYNERVRRLVINPISFGLALACLLGTLLVRDGFFRATLRYSLQSASVSIIIINVLFGASALPRQWHSALVFQRMHKCHRPSYIVNAQLI